ncbi:esterase [Enemella dayhoffiae]|uniref:Esterase n=1 Tax=Enemella dayhoffiae TaxID=2016507 RepID=A0A255HCJ2_9ACTN|nr:alpha/beta hydrolase family protein [Enemella dayhoffiae]OYO25162.1 esterase [Enemella dayhoffiae]
MSLSSPRPASRATLARAVVAGTASLALGLTGVALGTSRADAAPRFGSSSGITVKSVKPISQRTVEVEVTTAAVAPHTTHSQAVRLRVTLPKSYDSSTGRRYPVLYLFHGQDGRYSDWTSGYNPAKNQLGGDLETITANQELIVVTPEGGRAGWYTDWVNQASGAQSWETFHVKQLIPFIDANLRTKAEKKHRGIAGLSMGGFGAAHYATRYPDRFNYLGTFSGGIDLEDQRIRGAVIGSSILQGFNPPDGSFGPVVWPMDGNWIRHNPVRNAGNLKGMTVSLYAGSKQELYEQGAGWSTHTFSGALTRAGVQHRWDMYGQPGQIGRYNCDGGHNFGCWNMALNKDLPRLMGAIA